MAVTKAEADKLSGVVPADAGDPAPSKERTTTDDNVEKPGTTLAGDAPADTLDPDERVSSVPVRPGQEAIRTGTVNAVLVNDNLPTAPERSKQIVLGDAGDGDEWETYEATRPNGEKVTVRHNLNTGETQVS